MQSPYVIVVTAVLVGMGCGGASGVAEEHTEPSAPRELLDSEALGCVGGAEQLEGAGLTRVPDPDHDSSVFETGFLTAEESPQDVVVALEDLRCVEELPFWEEVRQVGEDEGLDEEAARQALLGLKVLRIGARKLVVDADAQLSRDNEGNYVLLFGPKDAEPIFGMRFRLGVADGELLSARPEHFGELRPLTLEILDPAIEGEEGAAFLLTALAIGSTRPEVGALNSFGAQEWDLPTEFSVLLFVPGPGYVTLDLESPVAAEEEPWEAEAAADSLPVEGVAIYERAKLAAQSFCADLKASLLPVSDSTDFIEACKSGFAEHVHADASCVTALNERYEWRQFWRAMGEACNDDTPWE